MSTLIFIDSRIKGIDSLIAGLSKDDEFVILDENRNGLAQIASTLAQKNALDAIHIISHGSDGVLYLADQELTSDTIGSYATLLAEIGKSLKPDGDILLYGCNVAASRLGEAFVNDFSALTARDVAASTDLTGAASLGGNAILEYQSGVIASAPSVEADQWDSTGQLLTALPNTEGDPPALPGRQ